MKQSINIQTVTTNKSIIDFISIWKQKKGYQNVVDITIGEAIELLIAVSYNLHFEYSDGRFFGKILTNKESSIGWEGEELLDILVWEALETIKKRLSMSGTFNEVVE